MKFFIFIAANVKCEIPLYHTDNPSSYHCLKDKKRKRQIGKEKRERERERVEEYVNVSIQTTPSNI